ncbi:cell division protein ZapE [Rouxiella sp. T17]|uniref:cell division protein ZapE n=1 Tax=Rouxiella sp. T17 TaxID=3085684 RepID=UPI002FCB846D
MSIRDRSFNFEHVMAEKAAENQMVLDPSQRQVIADLNALVNLPQPVKTRLFKKPEPQIRGLYIWGKVGRGKSFIVDSFFAAVPIEKKRRVHFHDFLRELHKRLNDFNNPDNSLESVLKIQLGDCQLLCFDELHLHDVGDAMLVKKLLELIVEREILFVATSNYPPDQLLSNPLYHARFEPAIKLIKQYMNITTLEGGQDYRLLGTNQFTPFCEGVFLSQGNAAQRRALQLPDAEIIAPNIVVGHRALKLLSTPEKYLHFSFDDLCRAPTAVMDYLALCETHRRWIIDGVPRLSAETPAVQQRFINVIDVLYDQHCQLFLLSEYSLATITQDVQQEDIQRTISRLSQLQHQTNS